jgi:alkylhydroperoxidase family enzyme
MARLPYLEADQVAPEYRDMLKRNTNLHKLLVNSPEMARAFNGIGNYIRFTSKLDPRLRELAILQVGWMEKSEYEFTHHVKIGKEFGVTDDDIAGLMAETEGKPSKLEPLARAILKGAREMVRELAMSDATFAEIKKELSDERSSSAPARAPAKAWATAAPPRSPSHARARKCFASTITWSRLRRPPR